MYCQLKEKPDHSFGLPVKNTFNRPKPVDGPDGTQHPATIFRVWTDKKLNAIGFARLTEKPGKPPEGKKRKSFTDKMTAGVVIRTWTHENLPAPPPPDPADYKQNRLKEMTKTIGGGNYRMMVGDEFDAFLKWAVMIRMKQSAVAEAIDGMTEINETSRTALKAALDPIFDLPAGLDGIIGKWNAAKGKFPKP